MRWCLGGLSGTAWLSSWASVDISSPERAFGKWLLWFPRFILFTGLVSSLSGRQTGWQATFAPSPGLFSFNLELPCFFVSTSHTSSVSTATVFLHITDLSPPPPLSCHQQSIKHPPLIQHHEMPSTWDDARQKDLLEEIYFLMASRQLLTQDDKNIIVKGMQQRGHTDLSWNAIR